MNSKEKILKEFDDGFGIYWSNYKNTLFRCNPNDILDKPSVITSESIKQFISSAIDQTREEMIDFDEELLEIGIQRILEPYFVVLDGRDNEPAHETVIEISRRIISKTKQSLKSLINK